MLLIQRSLGHQVLVNRVSVLGQIRCALPQLQRTAGVHTVLNQPPTPTVKCKALSSNRQPRIMDTDKPEVANIRAAAQQTEVAEPAAKRARTGENGANAQQQGQGQQQQKQQQPQKQKQQLGGKKGKGKDQNHQRIGQMHQAFKCNDMRRAVTLWREAAADGTNIATQTYNSLLYLAAGGEGWERLARGIDEGIRPLPPQPVRPRFQQKGKGEQQQQQQGEASEAGSSGVQASGATASVSGPVATAAAAGGGGEVAAAADVEGAGAAPVPAPEQPPMVPCAELMACGEEIWAAMQASRAVPDHGTFLALARMAAIRGDAEQALHWAQQCVTTGKHVQLRNFHPALVRYGLQGNRQAVAGIDKTLMQQGLDLTEYEFARLLEVLARSNGPYTDMRDLLLRIQDNLTQLSDSTLEYVRQYFETCPAAQEALTLPVAEGGCLLPGTSADNTAGKEAAAAADALPSSSEPSLEPARDALVMPPATSSAPPLPAAAAAAALSGWHVSRVEPGADGRCVQAGEKLGVVDLDDEAWSSFAESIADLAKRNMKRPEDFDRFVEWFRRNGPYDILVDGANVAYYGQNREGGGFSWAQIRAMMTMLKKRYPGKKVLLMLHRKRLQDHEANNPKVQTFVDELHKSKSLFSTPPGSNDDWYWMYACVCARDKGLLVSNDLLRDHIFSLLRPKHFLKWCERHIAGFFFTDHTSLSFELELPPPYSRCVQQLPNGTWMLPGGGRAINANMSTARDQTGQSAQAATAASASGGSGGGHGGHGGGEQGSDAEAAAANACSDEEYEPEWWLCVRPMSAAQRAQLKEEEANALAAADEKAKQDPAAPETA